VVLLDISMPQLNGFDAAQQLRRSTPDVRVIFVTMHADPDYVQAPCAPARPATWSRARPRPSCWPRSSRRCRGRSTCRRSLAALVDGPRAADPLTPRQREVLQLVAEGRTAREIAEILGVSRKTVEFHKSSIMRLLGLRSTAELTRYALDHGLLAPT
jgi:DNA-binding NarL/FixJ family response regulator